MQQINLYLPEFRPKKDLLSAERAVVLLGVLFAVLLMLYIGRAVDMAKAEKVALELETQQKEQKQKIDELKKAPKPSKDPSLEQEVARLRDAIRNRENVAEVISGRSLGNDAGFSRHLIALGRHKVDGVSLQGFSVRGGGAFLRLEGVSQKPELVPLYVSQLQGDENFRSTKFGYLSMQSHGASVQFTLSGDGPMAPETLTYFTNEQLQLKN